MTEDEAKTKWCPFARERFEVHDLGQIAITALNRLDDEGCEGLSRCIGSECMAWRWRMVIETMPMPIGRNAHLTDADGNWLGHCGLAGKS